MFTRRFLSQIGLGLAVMLAIAADNPGELKWERKGDVLQRTIVGTVSKPYGQENPNHFYKFPIDDIYTVIFQNHQIRKTTSVTLVRVEGNRFSNFVYSNENGATRIQLGDCFHYDFDGDGTIDAWTKGGNSRASYVRIDGQDVRVQNRKNNFQSFGKDSPEQLMDGTDVVFVKGKWVKDDR
ncbi:MAG: hypothetical protein ACRCZF_19315 [Gemmataceae bacterium]